MHIHGNDNFTGVTSCQATCLRATLRLSYNVHETAINPAWQADRLNDVYMTPYSREERGAHYRALVNERIVG